MLSLDANLMLKVSPQHCDAAIVGVLLAAAITIYWTSSKSFGKYESTNSTCTQHKAQVLKHW